MPFCWRSWLSPCGSSMGPPEKPSSRRPTQRPTSSGWPTSFQSLGAPTSRSSSDPTPKRWSSTSGPLMEQGRAPLMSQTRGTPAGWTIIDDVLHNIQGFEPRTKSEEQLYAEGLDQVDALADARRMRLVAAEEGVPGVLWSVLVFG